MCLVSSFSVFLRDGILCPIAIRVDNVRNAYLDALNLNPAYTLDELVASVSKIARAGKVPAAGMYVLLYFHSIR